MRCPIVVAACLLSGALGCAGNRPREARSSEHLETTKLRVQVTGEGAEFAAGGPALEVFVDGRRLSDQDGDGDAYAEFTPIQLPIGVHTIVTHVELRSADRKRHVTIASSERVELGDASASLTIDVVLSEKDATPAQRVEVRYGGERVRLVGGSLPTEVASAEPAATSVPVAPRGAADDENPLLKADRIDRTMKDTRNSVHSRLFVARSRRDVVVALCEKDKLSQIDIALASARDRRASLSKAIVDADENLVIHELTILSVLAQRVAMLDAESEECIGQESAVARVEGGGT